MYFVVAAMCVGAAVGAMRAKSKGGSRLDMAQYGGTFAILFGLVTIIAVIFLLRLG